MTQDEPTQDEDLDVEALKRFSINYLVERDKLGKFILDNFKAIKTVGVFEFRKVKPIREKLGDLSHLTFLNIISHSMLYLLPMFIRDDYKLGKLIGYFSVRQALATIRLEALTTFLRGSGLFWNVIENEKIQETLRKGWMEAGGGVLEFTDVDRENKRILCTMNETVSSALRGTEHTQCYFEVGILCGQLEYLFGGDWDGFERECVARGDPNCLVEVFEHGEGVNPELPAISSKEADMILDQYLSIALSEKKDLGRKHVKNFSHISITQSFNYLFISRSAGHRAYIMLAGRNVGRKIADKSGLTDLSSALNFIKKLFLDLGVGVLEIEYKPDSIVITVEESIFSSGVEDIGMKLCIYLAGFIRGCLDVATGIKWVVEESKCTADGDDCCQFLCKAKEPEELEELLLNELYIEDKSNT